MQPFIFLVNDEPFALFDRDINARTSQFLDSIDSGYFTFLAESHAEKLDSEEHKRRVATATRMAYLHGIETFVTLAGAAVQAPQAPYAWVALAKTERLTGVAEKISRGDPSLHTELRDWDRTWEGLAQKVFQHCPKEAGWEAAATGLARAWRVFAGDFLDEMNRDEYNSLKHGLRIRSSGVFLSAGIERQYGVSPPPEEIKPIGGSETGSTFFVIERAGPNDQSNKSRISRRKTVNWRVEPMLRALQFIDISISNLVSFIRVVRGENPGTIQFWRAEGVDDYESLVRHNVGVRSSSFDFAPDSEIPATKKKELLEELEKQFRDPPS